MFNFFSEPFEVIDLGVHLDAAPYPPWTYKSRHVDHQEGARALAGRINRLDLGEREDGSIDNEDFPESMGLAWSHLWLTDHAGNHIDAPYHFGPTVAGEPAKTIDQVSLLWCIGPGVRLDFRHRAGQDITVEDLKRELDRLNVTLQPGMIPLIWSGADAYVDEDDQYWQQQAGMSLEGLYFLLDQGVRMVGIDGYAMDVSFSTMQAEHQKDDPTFLPAHFAGREREHLHLEKLANLGTLPQPTGFIFAAFPIKIRGGSAGWVRPVAIVPRRQFEQIQSDSKAEASR